MATRETLADPGDPIHSHNIPVHDNGDTTARVTIPKHVREMLGIQPGDEIDLEAYRDRVVLSPKED